MAASDVGAVPTSRTINSKALTGNIILSAADVGAVPVSRTVNNKALSSNITLSAADVGAVPTSRKVNNKALSADITLTAADVSAVPTSRKVNNKQLSSDITLAAGDIGYNSSTTYSSGTIGKAVGDLNGAITSNPNIKFRSVGNSIMTGSVWVNGAADHMTGYNDSPYGIIAASLGIKQANVTHTMLSGSGMCSDIGNGTFYDYIVTNQLSLAGMDYLMTMLWTGDMYTLPVGSIDDTSASNTIAGKVIGIVNYLRTSYPSVKLILLGVPCTNWAIAGNDVFTGSYSNGSNIKQCDAVMHELADKYSFTFIDWEKLFFANYFQSFTDGDNVHPNADKIYRLIGEYFADNIKGQTTQNNDYLKVHQYVSDNVSGTTAEWKNLFSTSNPEIDEHMCVVDLIPRYRNQVLTSVPAWRVVKGNVQIYAALTEDGTTFNVVLARTNKRLSNGFIYLPTLVVDMLILGQEIDTTQAVTLSTYNSRKFSDYSFIRVSIGGGANDVRASGVYTQADVNSSKTMYLTGLSGANLETASGQSFVFASDTTIRFNALGSKLFKYVRVEGLRLW